MVPPLHFVERPGLAKARSLVAHLVDEGLGEPRLAGAALFVADGLHLRDHGRPLYGETWFRTEGEAPSVRGVLLGALSRRRETASRPLAFDRGAVSDTDLEAVAAALRLAGAALARAASAVGADAAREAFAAVDGCLRASPLWREVPDGSPFDLLAPARDRLDDDGVDDMAFVIRHASY